MKKLLALILCVMMFVAIIPTSAFAASISVGQVPSNSGWNDKSDSVKAIKDLKDDMKAMYYAIAADQTVFGVAKAYHDLADGLAKNLFDGVDSMKVPDGAGSTLTIYHDELVDNVRIFIKQIIGAEIMSELDANKNGWYDVDNDAIAPEKYLKAFSDAATKAVNSAKAQKGLESLVWGLAALKAQKSVNDAGETLYNDMVDWGMDKYDEFGFEDFLNGGQKFIEDNKSATWSPYAMTWTASADLIDHASFALDAVS